MFGTNARLPSSHESSALPASHRSAPLRPTYGDASSTSSRSAGPTDVPMADVGSRSATATASIPIARVPSYHQEPAAYTPRIQSGSSTAPRTPSSPQLGPRNPSEVTSTARSAAQSPATSSPIPGRQAQQLATPRSFSTPNVATPPRVRVTSLSHIQSFVADEDSPLSRSLRAASRGDGAEAFPQYEISDMPVGDVIEMVAGLLTKITTTNDRQHEHLHRQIPPTDGTAHLSQQTTSVLAFHGKNIPSISILSYLSRIHKYCPTTYEVFLSLLVYFDRMANRVNSGPMHVLRQADRSPEQAAAHSDGSRHSSVSSAVLTQGSMDNFQQPSTTTPPPSGSLGGQSVTPSPQVQDTPPSPAIAGDVSLESDPYNLSHFFVVDSFNIHRLVIAGVTCASKFFSDIFYTNSRYAKVGGLPLPELNHLELQFLLLNDFRLQVPLEEMEAYGTMLVEFYAREVASQQAQGNNPNANMGVN